MLAAGAMVDGAKTAATVSHGTTEPDGSLLGVREQRSSGPCRAQLERQNLLPNLEMPGTEPSACKIGPRLQDASL